LEPHYFLIASRDPYTHVAARRCYELAAQLAGEGRRVTLFLVQNGVLPARPGEASRELSALARRGVRVLADELSLRERGIVPPVLAAGVEPAPLEVVIEALEDGARALWH
jgi:sulfur relay (sulfurtransferase) complex TusBCD TusD component (DsrE family)